MLQEIIDYKKQSGSIEKRYREFIKDQSIPLDERWDCYCEAPLDWKSEKDYSIPNVLDPEYLIVEGPCLYDIGIDRGMSLNAKIYLEDMLNDEFGEVYPERVREAMEYCLQKNISECIHDW